jgi:antitoxin component HigA of HigAB toxin-antitoxin module
MNPWKRLHSEFKALMEEEDRIVRERGLKDWFHGAVTNGESGEFGCWSFASSATESLQARFELLATEAGIALGSPPTTSSQFYWLHRLFADLRANKSQHLRIYDDAGVFIDRLFEASSIFCARLDRQWLENVVMSGGDPRSESVANVRTEVDAGELSDTDEESVRERSEKRRSVVMPILASKGWTRSKLATKAGISKNSVYEYLNGNRNLTLPNRQALAEELGLKPEDLPD